MRTTRVLALLLIGLPGCGDLAGPSTERSEITAPHIHYPRPGTSLPQAAPLKQRLRLVSDTSLPGATHART
jgi:hypothetical protein